MTKDELKQIKELRKAVKCKQEQIDNLRLLATSLRGSEGSSSVGSTSDKVGNCVAKIVDLEVDLNEEICELVELWEKGKAYINKQPQTIQRMAMEYYYLLGYTQEEVAEKLNYSTIQIKRFLKI